MTEHTETGNCWHNPKNCIICGAGNLCDVCHTHDEARGECTECERCERCEQE